MSVWEQLPQLSGAQGSEEEDSVKSLQLVWKQLPKHSEMEARAFPSVTEPLREVVDAMV